MSRRGSVFQTVGSVRTGRSVFDLSYEKKFDCDMGQLIPILCEECVPGDIWSIGNEVVLRFQPLVAPILHSVHVYVHYFFVPYRLLWDDWEDFITGGVDGDFSIPVPSSSSPSHFLKGSLSDYFGFPIGYSGSGNLASGQGVNVFPWLSYNFIYDEYYRDQNLQEPHQDYSGSLSQYVGKLHYYRTSTDSMLANTVLNRAWTKDYFTSALPWQQRGTAPALPISGQTSAVFNFPAYAGSGGPGNGYVVGIDGLYNGTPPTQGGGVARGVPNGSNLNLAAPASSSWVDSMNSMYTAANVIDLSTASTFDIADLRLAFQIQKWLERNARAGARYTEFLRAHFPAFPRDDRLQRPEYIGGSRSPVVISEVLQTSATQSGVTPQANMAGHGISVDKNFCAKYHVQEFGLIMGLMSVMPRPAYQQGLDRQFTRRTKFDYYFPEFAHLSEQAILSQEIYATGNQDDDLQIFGYQGRYDELRVKRDMVCNNMRDTLDYWHLGRQFATRPLLNEDFIKCVPRKDIFAVQSEPGLLVNFGNRIRAVRPMPAEANPGLIDHF